jgi:transcriptional regulator with XRE-family HTH domain
VAEDPNPPPASAADRGRHRADVVDRAVGPRIRRRRLELGLTQQRLAELVGVTDEQVHRYEASVHRVAAGRLHRIARALGVEIGYFFEDVDPEGLLAGTELGGAGRGQRRRLLDLVRHAAGIRDPKHRQALCQLARALAALPGADVPGDPRAG